MPDYDMDFWRRRLISLDGYTAQVQSVWLSKKRTVTVRSPAGAKLFTAHVAPDEHWVTIAKALIQTHRELTR